MHRQPGVYPLMQIIAPNPPMAEAPVPAYPNISDIAVLGTGSMIVGDVFVADDVFVGFHNIIRADASPPCYIGPRTNLQDYVIIHCHPGETMLINGHPVGVYIDGDVSILHHTCAHGPLFIGRNTFVGQNVSIYMADIGRSCVIMHGSVIAEHVHIADNRFVAPGQAVWTQEQADALPPVPLKYRDLNAKVVDYYYRLGKSYLAYTNLVF